MGRDMILSDFEQALIRTGIDAHRFITSQGGSWDASCYVWTFILNMAVDIKMSDEQLEMWVEHMNNLGVPQRAIATLEAYPHSLEE